MLQQSLLVLQMIIQCPEIKRNEICDEGHRVIAKCMKVQKIHHEILMYLDTYQNGARKIESLEIKDKA